MAKGEGSSHAPESKADFSGERQRHMMGEGKGGMKGGDFGVGTYPGEKVIKGEQHAAEMLSDSERAVGPSVHLGKHKMHATAVPDHGPHHHPQATHDHMPSGKRAHHVK